ncbi:type IV secretion system protein [Ramlibacter sp. AN1133]|uniref:type IV secretion system protein n=1 Tax=Ramlibacter sp. AN1133 TaxID=3133429 RepID=UPI0030BBFEA6
MISPGSSGATQVFAQLLGLLAERATVLALHLRERMRTRRNIARAVLVVFAAACTVAVGQGAGQPPTPLATTSTRSTYSFQREQILSDISAAVSTKLDELKNNAKLRGFGTLLTAFFLVALLVWSSVKTMATGRGFGELIGEWVPIFVAFGIVTLFLDRGAAELIVGTMDTIGAAIGGANMATLNAALQAGADPIFRAISAVVDQPRVTSAADTGSSVLGVLSFLGASLGALVMSVAAKIVTAFLLVLAGVVMAAHIIMGFVSVELVLALAPVMVPFLMFRPLAWLFDGWLKFLLGACMLKIVIAFLLNVVAGLLTVMNELASRYANEARNATASETFSTDVLLLGLMLVFALLATLLLSQAPSIAAGLLSGNAGSVGFGGLRGISGGLANRVGMQAGTDFASGFATGTLRGGGTLVGNVRDDLSKALKGRPRLPRVRIGSRIP